MLSFQAFLQAILRVLLFRPLPPTSAQVTSKALRTYRANFQQVGSSSITLSTPELSFDYILSNKAGYPVSRREFLSYLSGETHTAENFQFLLFVLNYIHLYTDLSSQGAQGLSPPFTEQDEKEAKRTIITSRGSSRTSTTPPETSQSNFTDFGVFTGSSSLSSLTPPTSSGGESAYIKPSVFFANSQLSDEMEKCLAIYIRPGSPRELNLADLERALLVQSMQQSNHPGIFRLITKQLEPVLRVSYLDFVNTLARSPASQTKSLTVRLVGPALVVCSLVVAVIITLSKLRWEFRTAVIPFLFCGVVIAFCVEREVFVWRGEAVEELLEEGDVGRRKKALRAVVMAQGVWAGVLAASMFCAMVLLTRKGDRF